MRHWTAPAALGAALLGAVPVSAQASRDSSSSGTPGVTEQVMIPPAYRGAWASRLENCSNQAVVDRVDIYANGVATGEAAGRLEQITEAGRERSVELRLAFNGEGRLWELGWTLTLSSDGQQLTLASGTAAPDLLIRCPQN